MPWSRPPEANVVRKSAWKGKRNVKGGLRRDVIERSSGIDVLVEPFFLNMF